MAWDNKVSYVISGRLDMSEETKLMPEAEARTVMEWSTAVQVIEWCVDEMLDKIAEYPDDYGPGRTDEVMEAWERILRG
ncbi:MAG: hypothetical protein CMD33_01725 [Flavobacteriales bacterium]|jgi:hypothetical protein|nr:hypothetical protein [Flavobacteriales bacterium]